MPWLNHISMKNKLLIALLPMSLALCWFVGTGMMSRIATERQMQTLRQLMIVARSAGDAVHELQKERGMSAGFLGAGGRKFVAELSAQRKLTDDALTRFEQAMAAADEQTLRGDHADALTAFEQKIKSLGAVRARVSNLSIPAPATIKFYTATIDTALSFVGGLSQMAQSGILANALSAYYSLLNLKEQAGIERALLSNIFSADRFTDGQFRALSAVVARQDAWLTATRRFAASEQARRLEQALRSSEAVAALAMRDGAFGNADGRRFGIDPTLWFDAQTRRIEVMRDQENAAAAALESTATRLAHDARKAWQRFLAIGLIALLTGVGFVMTVTNHIHRHLTNTLKTIAEMKNDFTRRLIVPGSDELSGLNNAYNQAIENIQRMIQEIDASADALRLASGDIAAGNQNLAQRTDQQAASIVETSASIEQIATAVTCTADNAREAEKFIALMTHEVEDASRVADDATRSMTAIRASSEQIAQIVGSIDEISFQTNLLALNAAVEAARAGELGRGFTVVASEVRNLAQRCTQEANRIRELVGQNMKNIAEGVQRVGASGSALQAASANSGLMRQYISDIARAAGEQSLGVLQVREALNQLEQATQQNAALVSQVADASRTLDRQAESMAALVHATGRRAVETSGA